MMFNRGTIKNIIEQSKETYNVPFTREVKPSSDKCLYTVGTTPSGKIVLKIEDVYNVTLTMNDIAVRHLIRMLEAALPEVNNNQVDEE